MNYSNKKEYFTVLLSELVIAVHKSLRILLVYLTPLIIFGGLIIADLIATPAHSVSFLKNM